MNKLLALVVVVCIACTPAERAGVPILSTVDAIGVAASRVLGWCGEHEADAGKLLRARQAVKDRDYQVAFQLAGELVQELRDRGEPVPEETEAMLRLAQGAMAAQAIEGAMRALSKVQSATEN